MSSIPEDSAARRLIAYSFLVIFANDGTLDEAELKMLEEIALKDGQIDDEERKVLSGIFSRVSRDQVVDSVWKEMQDFREKNEIE